MQPRTSMAWWRLHGNIAETVLNTLHLSGMSADVGPTLHAATENYLKDPVPVLRPGPLAGKFFFGKGFVSKDLEDVRRKVNELCRGATICYKGACMSPGALTGPQMQTLWCKLKGALDDYCSQTLGQHIRK